MKKKELKFLNPKIIEQVEGSLMARLKHEINNPLTVIFGQLALIRKMELINEDQLAKLHENLSKIEANAQRIKEALQTP